ncbi:predicted protein [Chaetoceros tenuissimus]|uniref:Uncharacterized protein n=1 Tax=Chaetoceros tenuissimus TaxID=426638 RepID=A0AAD3H436_9STRA|nr:predicted protein [Chaetoceros tenuissimus]
MSSSDESNGPRCGINNKSMHCLQNVTKSKRKMTADRTSESRVDVSKTETVEERQQTSNHDLSGNECRDLIERESNGLEHESPQSQKHCKTKKKGLFKSLKDSKQSHSTTESNIALPSSQSLEAVTSGTRSPSSRAQGKNLKEVTGNTRKASNKKVVYGVSRRVDSLYSPKSKTKSMSTAEKIKKQKENSFAFSFTQVINSTPSTSSSPNGNEMVTSDQSLDFSKLPSDDEEKNSEKVEKVEKAVYSEELALLFDTEHEERKPTVRIHATEISCKEEDPGIPLSVTTSTENVNKEEDVPDTTFAASICGYTLSFVDAVGNAMLTCMDKVNNTNGKSERSIYTELNLNASESLDTVDAQLINEYERLNRMNSWDTFGTIGTTGTTTTTATQKSVDTRNSRSSSRSRKKKMKKTKRKKTVGFEYPPISSMKECPRITNEERKLLFFTEEELEEAERDRKSNISDDVEVVAIQKSMTEDSQSVKSYIDHNDSFTTGSKSFGKNRTIMPENKLTPSLKTGKYSKEKEEVNATDTKSSRSSNSQGSDKSPNSSSQSSKIKGVQIYLRQRSVR